MTGIDDLDGTLYTLYLADTAVESELESFVQLDLAILLDRGCSECPIQS